MGTDQRGSVRIEDGHKRVRTYLGGEVVADSYRPVLVWEVPYYPAYYLPRADVREELLVPSSKTERSPSRGTAQYFSVKAGQITAENAAWTYPDSPLERLRDLVRFDWEAMDAWFEEDERVYVHPRSPYTRVDILPSSRHVRIELGGVTVAESSRPMILFETGLPPRYYLPLLDVRMDLLEPSDHQTRCPYKGTASYWSIHAGGERFENIAWTYPTPLPESTRIAGLVAFWDERIDRYVDGELQGRPRTPFS